MPFERAPVKRLRLKESLHCYRRLRGGNARPVQIVPMRHETFLGKTDQLANNTEGCSRGLRARASSNQRANNVQELGMVGVSAAFGFGVAGYASKPRCCGPGTPALGPALKTLAEYSPTG